MTDGTYPDAVTGVTEGHSGSDTSAARARDDATSGRTSKRLAGVLAYVTAQSRWGTTVGELRDATGLHHGQASSALTNLHRQGKIARLVEKRINSHVYVATEFVLDRGTQPVGGRTSVKRCPHPAEVCEETERMMIASATQLREANKRLSEIHSLLHQHRYNGQPGLRLAAISQVVEPRD